MIVLGLLLEIWFSGFQNFVNFLYLMVLFWLRPLRLPPTLLITPILHPRKPPIATRSRSHPHARFPICSLPVLIFILLLHFPHLPLIQGLRFCCPPRLQVRPLLRSLILLPLIYLVPLILNLSILPIAWASQVSEHAQLFIFKPSPLPPDLPPQQAHQLSVAIQQQKEDSLDFTPPNNPAWDFAVRLLYYYFYFLR